MNNAIYRIHKQAIETVCNFSEGDERQAVLMGARGWRRNTPINTAELRNAISKQMIAGGRYFC